MNSTKQGAKLEVYVEQLFKDLCKVRVRRNVQYSRRGLVTKRRARAQIDVEYWDLHGKTIVECKYYTNWNVSAQDVEEFHQRSKKVFHNQKIMITTTDYEEDARTLAEKYGIKLVNGDGLKKMDYERLSLPGMVMDRLGKRKSLDDQIKDIDLRRYKSYHSARQYTI